MAVIYGGISNEREVSLKSGLGVCKALTEKGYNVIALEYDNHQQLIKQLLADKPDFAYIALHGRYGEDGRVQSLLELLNIPYVGSGVLASSLAMNKSLSKKHFALAGIKVAKELIVKPDEINLNRELIINKIINIFSFPIVIKPNQEGSTIGLTIAYDKQQLLEGLNTAVNFDSEILVEEYIKGVEITVAVLGTGDDIQALPVIEIVPKNSHYDYESKYAPGGSEHIIPARISKENTIIAQDWAIKAHKALGCETYSRVDFIVPEGQQPVILEINTLPGMTPTSLFPDAAKSIGLEYPDMLDRIIKIAKKKYK
ncbi:D-alanine--D-alanine ligase [Desulfuribacillus alkaliarsenatis]|uniref:D-alanine--D-alanine ligase n=1 Tax=Desulfuribacillus alkaliarsenatis TaxID=766136 RepID=A0A1E5G0C0_9FIRM|nr:D-alanine--D-alanine ligase [Desulfuribacillus alkaliarsenatis]